MFTSKKKRIATEQEQHRKDIAEIKEIAGKIAKHKSFARMFHMFDNIKLTKRPFIIEIEGTDGSGKETQTNNIFKALTDAKLKVVKYSFPNYDSDSSLFVKEYLSGKYGNVNNTDAYQGSMFFAIDRLVTYLTELKSKIEDPTIDVIILDRYIGSNLIHQGAKLALKGLNNCWDYSTITNAVKEYVTNWVALEINLLNLPDPDMVIFLDMPFAAAKKLRENRLNKINGSEKQDIHESDDRYLEVCETVGRYIADLQKWNTIKCANIVDKSFGRQKIDIKSIDSITKEIMLDIHKAYIKAVK